MNILHKISYDGHESVVRKPHSNCIMKSVSGEKISFSDGSDHPITRLVLSIDMNEDYNGYDKAWAGGEGKNLLPQFIQDGTYNGVTFTTNKDGSISSEGTATGAVYVASVRIPLESGTYYFTGTPAGGSASTYNSHADLYDGTTLLRSLGLDTGDGLSFTIAEEEAGKEAEFVLHIAEGVTAPEDTWKFFLCTENIPFEPYENISTLIPYDQVVLKVNGHYYVQDLPEEFCAGFVDFIAGRIVSSYHTDHTEKAEQTNITPREIHTQPGENKMSMNVPGTIEVIYCVDTKLFVENSIAESACDCTPIPNNITDPQDGQVMKYDAASGKWVNAEGGSGGTTPLVVNIIEEDESSIRLDHTWQEINDAYPNVVIKAADPANESEYYLYFIIEILSTSGGYKVTWIEGNVSKYGIANSPQDFPILTTA